MFRAISQWYGQYAGVETRESSWKP
jgi:hypothetical protein